MPRKGKGILIAAGLALGFQYLEYHGWFATSNGRVFNWVLARTQGESDQEASNHISILEIDNDAWKSCFGSAPMSATRVSNLVETIAKAQPAVIGVDIITDSPSTAAIYRANLAKLTPRDPEIIWASGAEAPERGGSVSFFPWLFGARDKLIMEPTDVLGLKPSELDLHRELSWGLPVYSTDEDSTLRRFPRSIRLAADSSNSTISELHWTWPRLVAEAYCKRRGCSGEGADEIYVRFGGMGPGEFAMQKVVSCGPEETVTHGPFWEAFAGQVKDKIVLIGGTFERSGDFYKTPLGPATAGLIVNAYAVKAELQGDGIEDVRQPWALIVDFCLGLAIIWLFGEPRVKWLNERKLPHPWLRGKRGMFLLGLIGLGAFLILTRYAFGGRYLLGFAGVGLAVLAHQVWEMIKAEGEVESGHHARMDVHVRETDIHIHED